MHKIDNRYDIQLVYPRKNQSGGHVGFSNNSIDGEKYKICENVKSDTI